MYRIMRSMVVVLIIITFMDVNLFAEEVQLSLSDCLNIGLSRNLDIKIAKIESRIQGENVTISEAIFDVILSGKTSYSDDQLATSSTIFGEHTIITDYEVGIKKKFSTGTELDIDYFDIRTWTDSVFATVNPVHEGRLSFTLRQPVMKNFFGYVDRRTVKLSKIEAVIANIEAKNRIEDAVADIEKAYWRLVFSYENVALFEELSQQAEKLYNIYKGHLETGFVEETDVYETEANMKIRKTDLLIAKNDLLTANNNLRLFLNEDENFTIIPKNRLDISAGKADLIKSLNEAFIANREYRIKKKNLEAKNVQLKMKENSLWPEVDLVGTLAVNGVDRKFTKANRRLTTNENPYYYGGIEVNFPIENREARGEFNKAILEKEKSIIEILKVEKDIATSIDEKVRSVNLNYENTRRFTQIREIQYLKFQEEEKKLKFGRSSSKIVIDYQRDYMLAAIQQLSTVLKYYSALIDLENEKDTLLEKVGVIG